MNTYMPVSIQIYYSFSAYVHQLGDFSIFLTNTASMMLLSTRNHTYKSFTPKPQKKQSQTPEASSAFNNTRRLFHIKPITHHHTICIFDFLSFYSPASPSPLLICYICFFLILYVNIVFHASTPIKEQKANKCQARRGAPYSL